MMVMQASPHFKLTPFGHLTLVKDRAILKKARHEKLNIFNQKKCDAF